MSESESTIPTLADIEAAALVVRQRLDSAAQLAAGVQAELLEVRTRHAPAIRAAAADLAEARARVLSLVEQARPLFRRPKSQTLYGLTVGLRQRGGTWNWPAPADLVAMVRQRLAPSRAAALIQITERVPISTLTGDDRGRLGIGRVPAYDEPVCYESETDTTEALLALLAETTPDAQPAPLEAAA